MMKSRIRRYQKNRGAVSCAPVNNQKNDYLGYKGYFFVLNPNIIATQPLAGVSPGLLKEDTFTTSLSC